MRLVELPDGLGRAFSTKAALEAGVHPARLRTVDLARPFHGVREIAPALTLEERCRTYAARMRPDEFFCSATAALLHEIPLPLDLEDDRRLHVAVPNPRRAPRSKGIIGHKFVVHPARGEVVEFSGLRVSSPERSWCELGAILDTTDLVAAGDHLIRPANRLSSAARLRATLERHPHKRTRERLEAAFALLDPGAESPAESALRVLLVRAAISGFRSNLRVHVAGRMRRIDLAHEDRMVALEYQGDIHRDTRQWRADMTRIAELESVGWRVGYVNADDMRDPDRLVARIRRLLAGDPPIHL
ncbi:hypothetical protein [Salinibacterium sp. ZJ77]|uniref:endonuclease domain-containing protein n=1 Tax=Salinibacterium sp. ZJ77 TaxID=2708337 RepID=UPI00141FAC9D|nr:hypothetical protein [Salinibacterium sp. ZJ77]